MGLNKGDIGEGEYEMAASYAVEITGIERAKNEAGKLARAVQSIRLTQYSQGGPSVTTISHGGGDATIFTTKIDKLEGRVQVKAVKAVDAGVKAGRDAQEKQLNAAVTAYGIKRMAGKAGSANNGGGSAGRNKTGNMIRALKTNVEVVKTKHLTRVTGWHGWQEEQDDYFVYQEKGTRGQDAGTSTADRRALTGKGGNRGIEAANSLGAGILIAREEIKGGLDAI